MCNSLQGCLNLEKTQKRNSHQELLDYLNDPLVQDVSDLVAWWGVSFTYHYTLFELYPNGCIE